ATVSPGTVVADDSLLGVHSVLHKNNIRPGTTWLGSPAIFFPKRQESEYFGDSLTYSPSWKLVLSRLFIEFWRVILPSCFTCALAFGFIQYYVWAIKINLSFPLFTLSLTPVYFALAFLLTLLVVAIKWILIGKYKPIVRPLWSNFVRRTELVTALYESIVVPCLLSFFTGTPFWPVILRLFGAKIGRRVYSETTYLTEFDLVKVGHDSAIESSTSLQTHLFEDRVMKVSNISIANKCSIGSRTIILYDSHISSDSTIDSLSLIMKGEKIPSHTKWRGIPSKIVVSN
ncbi:MAG: hypothetical protein QNJ53_16925, partial [Pleurocapsa sp. MO_192.B19]|nr:hypothetical protein [Pleurocapsa sp. MO_192.B19]